MILVVTGMAFEAKIVASGETLVVCGGGRADLARTLEDLITPATRGLVSFGLAGGLDPSLAPGDLVIADAVVDDGERLAADGAWSARVAQALPQVRRGSVAGVAVAAATPETKAALCERTAAIAVDMESQAVARAAVAKGLPFAVIRAIADPASRGLPPSALVGMRADGSADTLAVIRSLAKRPGDLPGLIRTAMDAQAARRALLRSRERLGPRLLGP